MADPPPRYLTKVFLPTQLGKQSMGIGDRGDVKTYAVVCPITCFIWMRNHCWYHCMGSTFSLLQALGPNDTFSRFSAVISVDRHCRLI